MMSDAVSYAPGTSFNWSAGAVYNSGIVDFNGSLALVLCNKDGEMTLTIIIKQEKMPRHYSSMDFDFYFNDAVGSKQMAQLKSDVAEKVAKLNIDEKVKDVLGSLESDGVQLKDNGDLILEGNVIIDVEKAKKGIYQKNGRKLIVQ